MKYQIQTHSGARRTGWRDVEVFDGTEDQAQALVESRAEDGESWRRHEWVEHVEISAERIAELNADMR